jgi:predicted RNA methylase
VFDRIYPLPIRRISSQFWTPVEVARRAADWLTLGARDCRVIDVGAGVGKFCAVGALTTQATFVGIEHRRGLVEIAEAALDTLKVSRASVVHGTLEDVNWPDFDAYYLYNPFEENLYHATDQLDTTVGLSRTRFWEDVDFVEEALDRARIGTRVVTYHGFGGRVPLTYRMIRSQSWGGSFLRLWEKAHEGSSLYGRYIALLAPQ